MIGEGIVQDSRVKLGRIVNIDGPLPSYGVDRLEDILASVVRQGRYNKHIKIPV